MLGGILIYVERQTEEKWIKIKLYLPYSIPILGVLLLCTTAYRQYKLEENKPVPDIEILNLPNGSARVLIRMTNFGNNPIHDVYYFIFDSYNMPKNPEHSFVDRFLADQYYLLNDITEKHLVQGYVSKKSQTVGTTNSQTIYAGRIDNRKDLVIYKIGVNWDKGFYNFFYKIVFDKELDKYKIESSGIEINDSTSIYPTAYFKNVPKIHWKNLPF